MLKGTADEEEIAAAVGNWDYSDERGEDAFFEGDQQGTQGIVHGTHGDNQNNNNNNNNNNNAGDKKEDKKDNDNNRSQQQYQDEQFQ